MAPYRYRRGNGPVDLEYNPGTGRLTDHLQPPPKVSILHKSIKEIDMAQGRPQFEDHPPAGRFFRDIMEKAKTKELPKVALRETPPVGDNVVLPHHYARFPIEPIRFIGENNLNFFQGNIVKYALRYDAKNGIEDIKKVQRYARMFELKLSGYPDWAGPDPRDAEINTKLESIFENFRALVAAEPDTEVRARLLTGITIIEARHHGNPAK